MSHLTFIGKGYALSLMWSRLGSCTDGLVDVVALDVAAVRHAILDLGGFQL